jgi:hypothetical protein
MRNVINPGILLITSAFLLAIGFSTTAAAKTIYVNDDGPADFNNIQAVINDANDGDTIIVADGIYRGNGNRDIDFKGKVITLRSENGPDTCVIDCQGTPENPHRGFKFHNGETSAALLDGLTITGGYGAEEPVGPAFLPLVSSGGAIFNINSSPTIRNCIFLRNTASYYGAGVYNGGGNITLSNCSFIENTAVSVSRGGGMYSTSGTPTLTNCTFKNNSAGYLGGALFNAGSNPRLNNCAFIGNPMAIYNCTSNSTFTNCIFIGNSNAMTNWYYSHPTLINCIFTGNSGGSKGTIYNNQSAPIFINCTFSGNSGDQGSALLNQCGSNPVLTNCILWDSGNEICDHHDGSLSTVTYSDIYSGYPGAGNSNVDPLFIDADGADNVVGTEDDNLRLLPDSPCIDAGDPNYVCEPNETDLDGRPRIIGGRIDMGAYEFSMIAIEVPMKFTPQAINCNSKGKWVKAHFVLPEEFAVEDVDANTPAKIESLGIKSDHLNVFINEDGLVEIEAAFDRAAFCDAVKSCGPIEITVTGSLTSGQYFYGTDIIEIIKNSFECLAILSPHWLELNCGKPNWCNGFDADRDTTVNLKDFAIMALHWLEGNNKE